MNSTTQDFICELESFLPARRTSKVGRPPIPVNIIITELYKLFKFNLGWRNIKHKNTCRKYLNEIQRRGLLNKFFNLQIEHLTQFRPEKTIVDSSDIASFKVKDKVRYSGKYHNYCLKMTVEVTEDLVPLTWSIDKGTSSDSKILEKILQKQRKLPYELLLDKGYENYERRRKLQKKNCQVRMEMKKSKNRKRGKRFQFTEEQKKIRYSIEKFYGWLKSFMCLRLNRFRKYSIITASFLFALNYYTHYLLN
jgi:hypothetical protein